MLRLNLPKYDFKLKNEGEVLYIYDDLRCKYLLLTPEEWVRQHFVNFLRYQKGVPQTLMKQEAILSYNQMKKRADILVYGRNGRPLLLIECKAGTESVDEDVFFQVITYNASLQVPLMGVTNGLEHYFACRNTEGNYEKLTSFPDFEEMQSFI